MYKLCIRAEELPAKLNFQNNVVGLIYIVEPTKVHLVLFFVEN